MPTFKVIIEFDEIQAETPLEAAKQIAEWMMEDSAVCYDVINQETKEAFSVDLAGEEVVPYSKTIKTTFK